MSPAHAHVRVREAAGTVNAERRQHPRYPITARSEYLVSGSRKQATTLDISSCGVLLKTDRNLRLGERIEVFIDWPVLLESRCPLRLVVSGRVVRSDARGTAVEIIRYEFRLGPASAAPFAA